MVHVGGAGDREVSAGGRAAGGGASTERPALYCASPQGPFLDQKKQPQQSGDLRGNQAAIDSYCVYLCEFLLPSVSYSCQLTWGLSKGLNATHFSSLPSSLWASAVPQRGQRARVTSRMISIAT